MRQRGDSQFIDFLNNVRIAHIKPWDMDILQSRIIHADQNEYPHEALPIFAENLNAKRHNQGMLQSINSISHISHWFCLFSFTLMEFFFVVTLRFIDITLLVAVTRQPSISFFSNIFVETAQSMNMFKRVAGTLNQILVRGFYKQIDFSEI